MVLMIALGSTGCSTHLLREGEPDFNTAFLRADGKSARDDTSGLSPPSTDSTDPSKKLTDQLYNKCPPNELSPTPDIVKQCVYALKGIIDDEYREYKIVLQHTVDDGGGILDVANLGLTTAATATPGAAAKTVLSAIATGLSGTKTIINEDVIYKQAIAAVCNQMDADRDQQFTVMLKEMNNAESISGAASYSMDQAKDDLLIYFADGTFSHALDSLQSKTAANKENCKAQLNTTKKTAVADSGKQGAMSANSPSTDASGGCNDQSAPSNLVQTPPDAKDDKGATADKSADKSPTVKQSPAKKQGNEKAG
jgi:hypothetical protein